MQSRPLQTAAGSLGFETPRTPATWTDGRLARALSIPVFETTSGAGNQEPREMRIGDVDGDGRNDLVLIAHDRVLIYLQEK